MELKEAIQLLKSHNEWRRDLPNDLGAGTKMADPKKLGIAIDKVVSEFENLFISDVVGPSEQLVCEHKYQNNICDKRGVRKCMLCGKLEKTN